MYRSRPSMLFAIVTIAAASPAMAVRPAVWLHEQPKDFNEGKLDNTVISSLGEVTLGREIKTLHELKDLGKIVNTMARAGDGKIYFGTGPKGVIYRMDGSKVTEFCTLPGGGNVISLLFAKDGQLLAGTGGGQQAKIYVIDGSGKARVFHEPPGASYIWAMVRGPGGEIYAATGNKGQLFKIQPDGSKSQVLADLKPKNLLCLAFAPDGFLYTGTDEEGLVYRISPTEPKPFVVYDAKEPEISAIVFDAQGNLYASTADADGARPGRTLADKPGGTPDRSITRMVGGRVLSIMKGPKPTSTSPHSPAGAAAAPASKPAAGAKPAGDTDADDSDAEPSPTTRQAQSSFMSRIGRAIGGSGSPGKPGGNAIYRIDTDGFVTEVFREPVMILAMTEVDGTIYAATGNEGRIYAINPNADRTVMLAKLEANQATCLLRLPDKRLIVGTANAAMLVQIADRFADKGTLTSKALDADQITNWGRVRWTATVPTGTKLTIATRSSNVEDDESDAWEAWSSEMDATYPQQISSTNARFLQYRLTFETTVPDATPTVRTVEISRIDPNRAPLITSLEVNSAVDEARKPTAPPKVKMAAGISGFGGGEEATLPKFNWVVKWMAHDPNNDPMTFEVFYRDFGAKKWIRLVKDLAEPYYIWDTRTVPDGKYEMRVLARDNKTNPPGTDLSSARIADVMLVDNTPPNVTIDSVEPKGSKSVRISMTCTDALSRIAEATYNVDSDEKWIPLAADDGIFDSPKEAVTFTVDDLDTGEHRIALKVADERGNIRYVSRLVTVGN
jgi:outer membrane protein assembly factor BamB